MLRSAVVAHPLPGAANLLGLLGGQFDHLLGHTFGHQFVGMVLVHQSPIGFFYLRIVAVRGYAQHLVGIFQRLYLVAWALPGSRASDKVDQVLDLGTVKP